MPKTRTQDYVKQGYVSDDCKMIEYILRTNWENDQLRDKVNFYFDEVQDVSSYNYSDGSMRIKVQEFDEDSDPMGIGFDSEESTKDIELDISTMDRDLAINARDEIKRIIMKYRLRPGNGWATAWISRISPIYPTYKFFHFELHITLRKYCNTLPRAREGWQSNEYY